MPSNFHEAYVPEEVKGGSDRAFGLTVGGILAAIGLYRLLLGASGAGPVTIALIVIGAALIGAALVAPAVLAPLNRLWTKLGLLLFKVVNPVVMLLIFALSVVPVGLWFRLRGRDPLRLKRDPNASSYWIERQPPGPEPATMRQQF